MTRLRALLKENVTIELHPFQRDAVDQIEREISEERRRLLYVAPTGAGKTVVGAEIINRAASWSPTASIPASFSPALRMSCGPMPTFRLPASKRCTPGRSDRTGCRCRRRRI